MLHTTAADYCGVTGVWTVHARHSSQHHALLVLSFAAGTRALTVGPTMQDVTEECGLRADERTLACGTFAEGLLAQVCMHSVHLAAVPTGKQQGPSAGRLQAERARGVSWTSSTPISMAAVAAGVVVLAFPLLGEMALLRLLGDGSALVEAARFSVGFELSCMSILAPDVRVALQAMLNRGGTGQGVLIVVGTYKPSVEVLLLDDEGDSIQSVASASLLAESVGSSLLVRHVALDSAKLFAESVHAFTSQSAAFLLVGTRSGELLRFEVARSRAADALYSLEVVAFCSIGRTPVSLVPISDSTILALSDRPWAVRCTGRASRVRMRPLDLPGATHATRFSSPQCEDAFLLVVDGSLVIAAADCSSPGADLPRIRRTALHKTPYHFATYPDADIAVVACNTSQDRFALPAFDLRLLRLSTGAALAQYDLPSQEEVRSVYLWHSGDSGLYLVVGTAVGPAEESARGRMLVFVVDFSGADEDMASWRHASLRLFAEAHTPGAVHSIDCWDSHNLLVAAGDRLLCFKRFNPPHECTRAGLVHMMSRHQVTHVEADASGSFVLVDEHDGILLYTVLVGDDGETTIGFECVGCDASARSVAGCCMVGALEIAGITRDGEVFVLRGAEPDGDDADAASCEHNLELSSSFQLGEPATAVHRVPSAAARTALGSPGADGSARPAIALTTVGGAFVVLEPITEDEYQLLASIERRMRANAGLFVPLHHEPAAPFVHTTAIDGDIVAHILDMTADELDAALADVPGERTAPISLVAAVALVERLVG